MRPGIDAAESPAMAQRQHWQSALATIHIEPIACSTALARLLRCVTACDDSAQARVITPAMDRDRGRPAGWRPLTMPGVRIGGMGTRLVLVHRPLVSRRTWEPGAQDPGRDGYALAGPGLARTVTAWAPA